MDKVQKWRINTKQRMVDSMGGKCQCCGYVKCNNALEFHHLDPSKKEFELKTALEKPKAWSTIVNELKKCVLLCANCHRELHADLITIEDKQYFDDEYTEYRKNQVSLEDECPVCGNSKPIRQKTCSTSCAGKLAGKVDWGNIHLGNMLKQFGNAEQVGKHLDISGAAVRKQIKQRAKGKEIHYLTLEECKAAFPSVIIDNDSLGIDNGVLFNTLAVRIDRYKGGAKVVEYLPSPGVGLKTVDFFVVIKDC